MATDHILKITSDATPEAIEAAEGTSSFPYHLFGVEPHKQEAIYQVHGAEVTRDKLQEKWNDLTYRLNNDPPADKKALSGIIRSRRSTEKKLEEAQDEVIEKREAALKLGVSLKKKPIKPDADVQNKE